MATGRVEEIVSFTREYERATNGVPLVLGATQAESLADLVFHQEGVTWSEARAIVHACFLVVQPSVALKPVRGCHAQRGPS